MSIPISIRWKTKMRKSSMTKLLVCMLCLAGCGDFTFAYAGAQSPTYTTSKQSPVLVQSPYGEVASCVKDDQCDDGQVCFKKDPNNYVGVCGQVNIRAR